MLLKPPIVFYKRHRSARSCGVPTPTPPRPTTPQLVSAVYDAGSSWLTLAFDRAVDTDAVDGSVFRVNDPGPQFARLAGNGGTQVLSPTSVRLVMIAFDEASGNETTLTVPPDNGVFAVEDGAEWTGVQDLLLPFP